MTLKQLIKLEDKAKEVWVISPSLNYDVENKDFSELVSVNRGQNTKYRYIVPATKEINKHLDVYRKMYKLSEAEIQQNFLILSETEFTPFILEIGIYDGSRKASAFAAPSLADGNEVIQFNDATAKLMAKQFKAVWKKYKRVSL